MTNAILRGKPDAGNPHVRFDEGEVASAKPRRGSLLYKKLMLVGGVALSATLAFGEAVPQINGNTYTFDMNSDDTYSTALSGAIAIVKKGSGKLTLTGNNTQTGDITIEGGTLAADTAAHFGKMTKLTVKSGATLDVSSGSSDGGTGNFLNCTLYISGAGASGAKGAIMRRTGKNVNGWYFGTVHLDGDATVAATAEVANQSRWGFSKLYLHGHTLTKSGGALICFNGAEVFPGDGSADDDRAKIFLNQAGGDGINLQAATVFHGNSNNEIRVASSLDGAIKFWDFKGTVPWTFHGVNTSGNRYNIGIYNEHSQAGATNVYQGPILMEGSNIEFQYGLAGYDSTFTGPATFKNGAWMAKYGSGTVTFAGPVDLGNAKLYASGAASADVHKNVTRFAGQGVVHKFNAAWAPQAGHVEFTDGCVGEFQSAKWVGFVNTPLATPGAITVQGATLKMPSGDGRIRISQAHNVAGYVRLCDNGVITNVNVTLGEEHSANNPMGTNTTSAFYMDSGRYYCWGDHGSAGTKGSYGYLGVSGGIYDIRGGTWRPGAYGYGGIAFTGGTARMAELDPGHGLGTDVLISGATVVATNNSLGGVYMSGAAIAGISTRASVAVLGSDASLTANYLRLSALTGYQGVLSFGKGAQVRARRCSQNETSRADTTVRFDVGFDGAVLYPTFALGFFDENYQSDPSKYAKSPDQITIYDGGLTVDTSECFTNDGKRDNCGFYGALRKPTGLSVKAVALPADSAFLTEPHMGPPQVKIEGNGHAAVAVATYDNDTRKVTGIIVTSPGYGYDESTTATVMSADRSKTYSCVVTMEAQKGTGGFVKRGEGKLLLMNPNSDFGGDLEVIGGVVYAGNVALPATAGLILHPGATFTTSIARTFPTVKGSGSIIGGKSITVASSFEPSAEGGIVCDGSFSFGAGAKLVIPEGLAFNPGEGIDLVTATALNVDLGSLTVEGTMPNDCKLIVKGGKTLRLFNPKGLNVLVK